MQRLRILIAVVCVLTAPLTLHTRSARAQGPPERVEPGTLFPPGMVQVLEPGSSELEPYDLGDIVGSRAVVFVYFLPGESVGEEAFVELQDLVAGLDGIALIGALRLSPKLDLAGTAGRLELFGASVPVVVERQLELGYALGVTTSPSIAVVDHRGILRLSDAKSLKQVVSRGMTLEEAIRNAARRGPVPTVSKLPRYYPANDLIGEQFPDFILKTFGGEERVRLSDRIEEGKVTGLLFWHPNCKHCKKAMPGVVVGYHSYEKWLNVVSVIDLKDANEARNARDTIGAHKIVFPVLEDEGRRVTDLYKVISTPTMFFIGPDGVVDSVYTSGDINYVPVFSSRIRSILKVGREYEDLPSSGSE